MFSLGRKSKAQKEVDEIAEKVEAERKRLLFILEKTDVYTQLLDPLIETYLDDFRVYTIMYKRWQDKGFPATETYVNKNGAKNAVKHPLSVQVDIWSDKKLKVLERLGMTNKALAQKVITGGTTVNVATHEAEKEVAGGSAVVNFKRKWKGKVE